MSRLFSFPIFGNPDDPCGNPMGYVRQTFKSKNFSSLSKKYNAWKDHVVAAYYRVYPQKSVGKPFQGMPRGKISAEISFRGEKHADPENVLKGIMDALFENDKEMDTRTEHKCGQETGMVRVEIEIE